MTFEWKNFSLEELCSFKYGKFLAKSELAETGYPVFSGYGVVGYLPTYMFKEPQLLIVCRGEGGTGDVKLSPPKCSVTNLSIVISPDDKIVSKKFLYWALKATDTHCLRTGSAQAQIVIGSLQKLIITIPTSRLLQDQIASVLDSLESRITLLRETNATLEAIAQALFKSWFVDFDPVRAKSEGKLPEGMDEATASLFPDSFEQSELGEIPKGWQIGKVIDLGEVICGKTPPTSNINNYGDEVPFITIPDMHGVLTITTTTRSLSKLGADSQNKKYLRKGAVCVSCIATAGLVASVTTSSQTNQQINSVVPSVLWGDAFTLLLLRRIGEVVRSEGSGGSVFHNLNKSNFELIKVLLPTSKLAISFDQMISPLIEKITENQLQIKILSDLRDTLLPRLISGQIRLSDEEEINSKIKVDA
jgi:type I restriction enzyme S subunit